MTILGIDPGKSGAVAAAASIHHRMPLTSAAEQPRQPLPRLYLR